MVRALGASRGMLRFSSCLPDMKSTEGMTLADRDRGLDRVANIAVLIGVVAAVIAGATIWLLITDPITVANAVNEGQISPLVQRLAEVLYDAIASLLRYL